MATGGLAPRRRYQSKHLDQRRAPVSSLPLGIDCSMPPQEIPDGAATVLTNWEYSVTSGNLRTSPGIKTLFSRFTAGDLAAVDATMAAVDASFAAVDDDGPEIDRLFNFNGKWLYNTAKTLWSTADFATHAIIGTLNGDKSPEFHIVNNKLLIASGAKLQQLDTTLTEIADSPSLKWVGDRKGRTIGYGGDYLYYSKIGNAASWTHDTNDVSSGYKYDIGLQDSGEIVAVDNLSDVLVVYKSNGRAFAVLGEPPSVTIREISHGIDCLPNATVSVRGKSYYAGKQGMHSIIPTQQYDNMRPDPEGLAINGQMMQVVGDNVIMRHIPSRQQIWIGVGNTVYLYHYSPRWPDGRGAFTMRVLSGNLNDVREYGGKVYAVIGGKIGVIDESLDTENGNQIVAVLNGKLITPPRRNILVKQRRFLAKNLLYGNGLLTIGKKVVPLIWQSSVDMAAVDATMAAIDATFAVSGDSFTRWHKAGGGGCKALQPTLVVNSGAIELENLDFEYVEV